MGKRSSNNNHHGTGRGTGVQIAPSLLAADFSNLKNALMAVRRAGLRWIHLDIMDGHFVPNISFGPGVIRSIRPVCGDLRFDVHLMVERPEDYFDPFIQAGSQSITFHIEAAGDQSPKLLKKLRERGLGTGISLRPTTDVSEIRSCLPYVDIALVMTVEPGFGGQELIPHTLNKVRELMLIRDNDNLSFLIQVDGGINRETAPLAVAAGADVLVAGTSVFRNNRVQENVKALRQAMLTVQ